MYHATPRAFALLLALFATTAAVADDPTTAPSTSRAIHLKSGTVLEVKVLDMTELALAVEFAGLPGSRGSVPRNAIAPSDWFGLLVEHTNPASTDAWLALAKEAGALGLHANRMWSLRHAARLDPARAPAIEQDIAACRQACSTERLGIARAYLEAGELERARRYLRTVLVEYRECLAGAEAQELEKTIEANIDREQARAAAIQAERKKIQDSHEDLQAIRDLIQSGELALRDGRLSLARSGNAIGRFNEAHALFERAWRLLRQLEEVADATRHEVARLESSLRDDQVAVHVELGHVYASRSSFARATAHAGAAAALDPENPAVLALRVAIAAARAKSGGR